MKAYLVIVDGPLKGSVHVLPEGGTRVLGRASDADWTLVDTQISRHHCIVWLRSGKVFLRDLSSRNGTFIEGERMSILDAVDNEHPDMTCDRQWFPGEEILVGESTMQLILEDQPDAVRPAIRVVISPVEPQKPAEIKVESTITDTHSEIPEIKIAELASNHSVKSGSRMESLVFSSVKTMTSVESAVAHKRTPKPVRISPTQTVDGISSKKKFVLNKK